MGNYTIGVLALQGAVSEHLAQIQAIGATAQAVKNAEDLANLDAIILPGGESSAMGYLLRKNHLLEPLKQFAQYKPVLGTCAGMVLLAKKIDGETTQHLGLMDINVKRNASGRQIDSFQADLNVKGLDTPFPAVFIRAPYIKELGENVEVLAEFEEQAVLAKQDNWIACAFHPELTPDTRIIQLLANLIQAQN